MRSSASVAGRRILITGAARGIGATLAVRLASRGAHVALVGLEGDALAETASRCGDAPWAVCDVADRASLDRAVTEVVAILGGLDVVVANAGVVAQLPLIGGDPAVWDRTIAVNLTGAYDTVRLAAPYVAHRSGYVLLVSSIAGAVHPPLLGAYAASKAGVEALGDSLRPELTTSGARVGIAYFGEIDTEMTAEGFSTKAARVLNVGPLTRAAPVESAAAALEHGIEHRSRVVVAPRWVRPAVPFRTQAQRVVELALRRRAPRAVALARTEHPGLTTPAPRESQSDGRDRP
ncbi:SDR family NAD(P)-dependent oxidoreductase [Mumia qirimensis]|uniref:SDR family NAD(P)-dependent oxidoreductase n=1 Tax=Mumia qirimensis TaxID=3234852 RepID=UPI00351CFD9D